MVFWDLDPLAPLSGRLNRGQTSFLLRYTLYKCILVYPDAPVQDPPALHTFKVSMVDGYFARSAGMMAGNANGTSPTRRRRRLRAATSISQHLEVFRAGKSSASLRDVLADVAMRLVDSDDRDEFEGVDGPTALMDHLNRITEEQATLGYAWEASTIGEGSWEPYEVQESLILTIVAICHACIEETIGRQCLELGAGRLLWEIYVCAPIAIASELYMLILSAYRNLAFAPALPGALPEEMIHESWRLVAESAEIEQRVLGAEILTNLSVQDPSRVHPTQEHIATLLQLFFTNDDETALRIALVDLLSNLACDPGLCLLIIYELDERKPRRYRRHSGAVYFLDLTEVTPDPALQQSMEALAHNLSWSDPAGKRKIQKLGLSSFMTRFALEPAINN